MGTGAVAWEVDKVGRRRGVWQRMLLLAAVLGLLWTTLVAAGGEPAAEPVEPPATEAAEPAEAEAPPPEDQTPSGEDVPAESPPPPEEQAPSEGDAPAESPPPPEPAQEPPPDEQAADAPAESAPPLESAQQPPPDPQEAPPEEQAPPDNAPQPPPDEQVAPHEDAPPEEDPPPEEQGPTPEASPVEAAAAADEAPAPESLRETAPRAVAPSTSITTRKFTDPPRASDSFPFDLTGPGFADSFSIAHAGSHTSTLPGAGSYTLTETVPSGWKIVDIDCTDGAVKQSSGGASSITLAVSVGDTWDCTVTDRQLATIVIEKSVDFDDDTAFDFTGELGPFTIDPAGTTGSVSFPNVDPDADYTVTETVPTGWDFVGVLCSDKTSSTSTSITIDPTPGGVVTCTFTNAAQEGTITVVKEATPADGTDFPFTIEAGRLPEPFTLDDDADPTLPDRESFDRPPGTWTVTEAPPPGWEVEAISCTNGQAAPAGTTSIDVMLGAGGDVTCTFTNRRQQATIVIQKDVDFDDDAGFDFTGDLGDFTIDPDGLSGSQTFANLDPDIDYTVTETVPAGWDFAGVLCSDKTSSASPSITIDPTPGGTTTCTFTNEAQQGTVTVVKVADPVDGTSFTFGGDLGAFQLVAESEPPPPDPGPPERSAGPRSAHQQTFTVDPGSYDIVEDVPAGWLLRSAECESGDGGPPGSGRAAMTGTTAVVGPGEDVTCSFANVKLGSLTIAKDADPADGTRFPVTVSEEAPGRPGSPVGSFELAHGDEATLPDLPPARYVVAEDPPAGWGLLSADCGGAAVAPGDRPGEVIVTVGGGEDVRCTLLNRRVAEITIAKEADVDDGTQFPFSGDLGRFFLTSSPDGEGGEGATARQEGTPELPPTGAGHLAFTVDPGTYVVTEDELAGWDLAGIECRGGATAVGGDPPGPRAAVPPRSVEITVVAGDDVTCTFSNEARPGSLTIRKEAEPADGTAFDFTFAPGEGEERFALRDGEERRFAGLRPATYRVVETAPAGWGVGEIDCGSAEAAADPPTGTVDVTIGPGKDVTCVFHNTDTATIIIVKDAEPPDGTDFAFAGDLGRFELDVETPAPPPGDGEENGGPAPQPRQIGDEALPDRRTFEVAAGSYTVVEDEADGWELAAIDCGAGQPPPVEPPPAPRSSTSADIAKRSVTIEVAPGETVECTFRNRPEPVPLTIVKEADPADGTAFEVQLIPAGGMPTTLALRAGEQQTVEVGVGDLVIAEQLPSGWGLREVRCDSPAAVDRVLATARVTIRPGTPQTCTLVNTRTARITIAKIAAPLTDTTFGFAGGLGSFSLTVAGPPPEQPPGDGGGEGAEGSGLLARQGTEEGPLVPAEMSVEVDPGTYAVTEQQTAGWELVAIACDGFPADPRPPETPQPRNHGGSQVATDLATATAKLTVEPGDVVSCTFENRQVQRGLTIVKQAEPADGTDFAFAIEGGGPRVPAAFTLDDDADPTHADRVSFEVAGPVVVTETGVDGWDLVSIGCDVAGAKTDLAAGRLEIDLPAGAAATCTFTNHRRGAVTVIKSSTPAGGTGFPFTLEGDGGTEELTLDDGGRATIAGLVPGRYSLTEKVPAGWALRQVSCAGAEDLSQSGATVEFELSPGGNVLCTFADVKLGSLRGEVFLDLNGDGARDAGEPDLADVTVAALWAGFDGEFGTGDDDEFTTRSVAGNSYAFAGLPPGTYRVTVSDPSGLVATRDRTFVVEVAPGQAAEGAAFAFAGADLELTITSSTRTPRATVPFQLTVTVLNRGPQAPGGVTARVELSAGLRFDRASGDGTYDAAAGRWSIGDVPAGATRTLVLTVTPLRAGDVVRAEAEVSASSLLDPDSTPGNDVPDEDDQDATASLTVGVAPTELLPVTGSEAAGLVPPALVFLLGGLVLVAAGRGGRRRRT